LQNSETIGSVTLTCSGGAATAPVSGSPYSITPSDAVDGTFATNNYNITYNPGTLTITAASVALTVGSSLNPSGFGDSVTFTATVSPSDAGGDVIFKANGTPLGTNTVSTGTATNVTATLPRGTNTITAEYSGGGNYLGSTNALAGGQVVTNHPPVASATTSNCTPSLSTVIQITGTGGLASDADGDTLTTTISTVATAGTNIVFTAGGDTYIYYKNTNAAASSDSFIYKVTDGFGGTNTATITINMSVPPAQVQGTLSPPEVIGGGPDIRLTLLGYPGYRYALEWTNSIGGSDPWIPLSTNPADGTGLLIFTNSTPDQSQNYYRTRWVP
jgi:hypothetical protein